MKAKEYLRQAYRLDQRISSEIKEMERLREMATSVASSSWDEKVCRSRNKDAPFVRCLERIIDLECKINMEVDRLVELKEEIRSVIEGVQNPDEQMVLRYRYIHNYTWDEIGDEMNADKSTVRRWHGNALNHAVIPQNPLTI